LIVPLFRGSALNSSTLRILVFLEEFEREVQCADVVAWFRYITQADDCISSGRRGRSDLLLASAILC